MTSARKEAKTCHNSVENICRKVGAFRRRETILNSVRRVSKWKSRRPDRPQSKTKKASREVLGRMAATQVPVLDSFSSPERRHSCMSSPEAMPLRISTSPQTSSPQEGMDSVILASPETCSQQRPWSDQSPPFLMSQSSQGQCFPSKDLDSSHNANSSSTSVLGSVCSSGRNITSFTPWDRVKRKLSLNDYGK